MNAPNPGNIDAILEDGEDVLAQKVWDWVDESEGWFWVGDIDKELGIISAAQKQNRRQIVHTLLKKGKLHKDRNRQGRYKKSVVVPPMSWWDAPIEPLNLTLPFGLSDGDKDLNVKIFNGNIIVCAAPSNFGKTILAYNFIEENIDTNPFSNKINLVVSEQDKSEVRYVLEKSPYYRHAVWKEKVNIVPKQGEWSDIVVEDAINVLDYITDYSDAWGVGEQLRGVYEAMYGKPGVIWCNLQIDSYTDPRTGKTVYKELGRGGSVTLDLSRLYMSIKPINQDISIVKIKKGKFGKGVKPSGFMKKFKVTDDGEIIESGIWYRD
jgi:hypothetical protein